MMYKEQMKTKMIMMIIVMHPAFSQCMNLKWLQYPEWLAMLLRWCKRKPLVLVMKQLVQDNTKMNQLF